MCQTEEDFFLLHNLVVICFIM